MKQKKEMIEDIVNNFQSIKRQIATKNHEAAKDLGITLSQTGVLFLIKHKKCLGVTEIANVLGISKSAATQLVDGLVENHFLTRKEDKNDRRFTKIELTEKSKKHLTIIRNKTFENFSTIFETLTSKELTELSKITKKLADNDQKEEQHV